VIALGPRDFNKCSLETVVGVGSVEHISGAACHTARTNLRNVAYEGLRRGSQRLVRLVINTCQNVSVDIMCMDRKSRLRV
jgi:hypothetical protein